MFIVHVTRNYTISDEDDLTKRKLMQYARTDIIPNKAGDILNRTT